jgi:hypothetical protein
MHIRSRLPIGGRAGREIIRILLASVAWTLIAVAQGLAQAAPTVSA